MIHVDLKICKWLTRTMMMMMMMMTTRVVGGDADFMKKF